jgi:hypothetical protein
MKIGLEGVIFKISSIPQSIVEVWPKLHFLSFRIQKPLIKITLYISKYPNYECI